ncbi:YibE/F family protein [Candidatus Nomurabacteria bacterium]|nr:YibE/F family protein [Candidatus Kaiserbacteria bacterium]MCB9810288.1 YibE/F family protein [Candidatus Nomurabacteria bacterium]
MLKTRSVRIFFALIAIVLFLSPGASFAQGIHNDYQGTHRGKVVEVKSEEIREIPGTDAEHLYQEIEVEVLDGPQAGEFITIENDYLELEKGDKFYFNHNVFIDGTELYAVVNIDRRESLIFFAVLFVVAVIAFGGWQGVRSIVALVGSFVAIFYVLLPGLLHGFNPLFVSLAVASVILASAIFFTHGFNRESVVAYSGTMIAVLLTGVLAIIAVSMSDLSGFVSDESVYLNINTDGALNFTGLLLGAIIIGVLGVLDDIAITQAAVVTELFDSNKSISRREVYSRALRVGREHVGALVNTLVLAYAGVSLPLLLYFYMSPISVWSLINSEVFATEIIRTIVGSIGLIMTVPIVTGLAVFYLKGYKSKHSHGHSHGHIH